MIPLTHDDSNHSATSSPTMSRLFPSANDTRRRASVILSGNEIATDGSDVIELPAGSGVLSSMAAATSAAAFVAALAVAPENEVTRSSESKL